MQEDLVSLNRALKDEIIIAIDVGGTNTRTIIATLKDNRVLVHQKLQRKVQSKEELFIFISETIKGLAGIGEPSRCIIDFAGPLFGHEEVQMTNWENRPEIRLEELVAWGLPESRTLMLNDMEAAAFGILQLAEQNAIPSSDCINLYKPSAEFRNHSLNRILLAPGTGLGTACIIVVRTQMGDLYEEPIASEVQHSAASPLDDTHELLIRWLKQKKKVLEWPSWEDLVSGPGLVNIYEGFLAINNPNKWKGISWKDDEDQAALIAEYAVKQIDPICENALDLFYRCTGRVAQILALMCHPYGGIFLCGDSTKKNEFFIQKSQFVKEIHANPKQNDLLRRFPIYLVIQQELNILGGIWACKKRIHP